MRTKRTPLPPAREAHEEAGVRGSIERVPFISYRHCKPKRFKVAQRGHGSCSFVRGQAPACAIRGVPGPDMVQRFESEATVAEVRGLQDLRLRWSA